MELLKCFDPQKAVELRPQGDISAASSAMEQSKGPFKLFGVRWEDLVCACVLLTQQSTHPSADRNVALRSPKTDVIG